jgi:CorA-like Mg2+ transporter protein
MGARSGEPQVLTSEQVATVPDWLRRVSAWRADGSVASVELEQLDAQGGFPWFELACRSSRAEPAFELLAPYCPGLTRAMLEDLLTPDDEPAGSTYADGSIRLASTFSVVAQRPDEKSERGAPQGVGVLVFQPVELLAGSDWLIGCWHPRRTFQGAGKIGEQEPEKSDAIHRAVAERWEGGRRGTPGDLGVSAMHELALSYAPAYRALSAWLEDWELSLYVEDEIDNYEQLPELWGLMAALRSWLSPLNKPGLRADVGKAWLPVSDHGAVVEVDDRVDKALDGLAKLSATMRQSFGLLHVAQAEEQQRQRERMQHRLEVIAAAFLAPTLIVGFFGANTWLPGEGRTWGFEVMLVALVAFTLGVLFVVFRLQRRSNEAARRADTERRRMRGELLRGG